MKHRSYETLYILRPELKDEDVKKVAERFKKVVEDKGGEVSLAEKQAHLEQAYAINGVKNGTYVLMNFSAPADVPAELNRLMRISDDVIRHTIVKHDK